MKFLSVSDGVSIKKSEIIMVSRLDGGGTRVTTSTSSVESIFPYETILSMLENDMIEENVQSRASETQPQQFWRL